MSDPVKPEPVVVPEPAPAEVVDPAPAVVEPAPAAVQPAPEPVVPVVVERRKRGIGAWSFVLGLLTALVDIGFAILLAVTVATFIGGLTGGDFSDLGIGTAVGGAGLILVALFIFFGGFLTAGLGALLGLVALVTGRGRVLGFFGLLFAAGALVVRILLLVSGNFVPGLSD